MEGVGDEQNEFLDDKNDYLINEAEIRQLISKLSKINGINETIITRKDLMVTIVRMLRVRGEILILNIEDKYKLIRRQKVRDCIKSLLLRKLIIIKIIHKRTKDGNSTKKLLAIGLNKENKNLPFFLEEIERIAEKTNDKVGEGNDNIQNI